MGMKKSEYVYCIEVSTYCAGWVAEDARFETREEAEEALEDARYQHRRFSRNAFTKRVGVRRRGA